MVLYKDVGQAGTDTASGRAQLWMTLLTPSLPLIQSGKLRPLAVSGPKRMASLPDVPTFREIGFPTLQAASWYAILRRSARRASRWLAWQPRRSAPWIRGREAEARHARDRALGYFRRRRFPGVLKDEMERIRLLVKLGTLKPE